MKNNLWISLLLVLLVSGCSQKEEFNNQNVAPEGRVFTTSFENNQSRTFVKDGYLSCWTADDRISLFDGNTLNLQYKFYGKTGDNGGTFLMDSKPEGTGSSLTTNYAVYPYSENVKITTDGVITVNLPSEQHYAENSFGLGDNTMVAVTQDIHDTFLNFKNVGGCLKLQLYGNDATIQTITFTGNNKEKIAGKATLTVAPDENPTVNMSDDATTSITLDCGNGVTISNEESSPTTFWMVIPPITFTKGFTITITTTDDVSFTLSTSESIKINRNSISSINALEMKLGTGTLSLPTGNTFNNKVKAFLDSNTELTKIKFIANSATISNDILVTDEDGTTAYMVANEEWLEIHTNGRKFIANQNSGHMFSWYKKLTTIDFGKNFDVCNVEDMRYMFDNCTSLSFLDLSARATATGT
jgi:hypothetical protein